MENTNSLSSLLSLFHLFIPLVPAVLIRTVHAKSLLAAMLPVPKGSFEQILAWFLRRLATVRAVDPKAMYLPGCSLLLYISGSASALHVGVHRSQHLSLPHSEEVD